MLQCRPWPYQIQNIPPDVGRNMESRTEPITIRSLVLREAKVCLKKCVGMIGSEVPPIDVIFFQGFYYLWDGHHRVIAALMAGEESLLAKINSFPLEGLVTDNPPA